MKNSKGVVLPVALSMLALFGALGTGVTYYTTMQGQGLTRQALSTQALWLADAGLQQATASSCNAINSTNLGAGSYRVTSAVSGSITTLTATGTVQGVTRRLRADCTVSAAFKYAAFAGQSLTLDGSPGSIFIDSYNSNNGAYNATTNHGSQGNIATNGASIVGGTSAGVVVNGTQTTNAGVALTSIAVPAALQSAGPGGPLNVVLFSTTTLTAGDYKYSSVTIALFARLRITGNVRMYVTGNFVEALLAQLEIADGATLKLYVDGTVSILGLTSTGSNNSGKASNFIIYSRYNSSSATDYGVTIGVGSDFVGAIYAPDANILLYGSALGVDVYGTVVGKNVTAQAGNTNTSSLAIHYDQAMSTFSDPTSFPASLRNWVEL